MEFTRKKAKEFLSVLGECSGRAERLDCAFEWLVGAYTDGWDDCVDDKIEHGEFVNPPDPR